MPQSGDRGLRGPIRGYPPSPGQADPVYPPGQFSPWNRASTRAAWLGGEGQGSAAPGDEAEPGYSALAVSDPSADATTTQTWEAINDGLLSDKWAPARTDRDWGSHSGETGPVRQRTADGRPPVPAQPAVPRREAGRDARSARTDTRSARAAKPAPSGPAATAPGLPQSAPAQSGPRSAPAQSAPHESIFSAAADNRARPPVTREEPGDAEDSRSPRGAPGGRRLGKTGKGRSRKRHNIMMTGLLIAPVIAVVLVVAGYVYVTHKPAPSPAHPAAAPSHHAAPAALASPSPTLGPWKHLESRALDPAPLTLGELFPAQFTNSGVAGVRTVDKASTNCPREVFGSKLATAVRKADCTQVLRASYLSTDHKIMATVGVLNLTDVAAAEHAGKVSGATEFIKQLPAAHGPTKNLSKGTGIEEAEFKGHYLILIWTEYANLRSPQTKSQRKKLEAFSTALIAGTANISLTNRMVNGRP